MRAIERAAIATKIAAELSAYDRVTIQAFAEHGWLWDIDGWAPDYVRRKLIERAEDKPGNAFKLTEFGAQVLAALRAEAGSDPRDMRDD